MGVVIPSSGSLREDAASGARILNGSLNFNSANSQYLNRTFGTPTDNKKWTFSCWIKRSKLSVYATAAGAVSLFCTQGSGAQSFFGFSNNDADDLSFGYGGYHRITTTGLFRDLSAWYHIILVFDSANATAADRGIIYINGTRATVTTPNAIGSNDTTLLNSAVNTGIGRQSGQPYVSMDMYLSEVIFVDGQALDPSSLGFTDPLTNTWRPKKYTGTFGNNGFYLPLDDDNAKGTDRSGNGNNWTANNFSGTFSNPDVVPDSPSGISYSSAPTAGIGTTTGITKPNNYCTANPLKKSASATLSDGNLSVAWNSAGGEQPATFAVSSGKWYWEVSPNAAFSAPGILLTSRTPSASSFASDYHYYGNTGLFYTGVSGVTYGAGFGNGDVIGVALDLDTNQITFYKNGVSQGAKTIAAGEYNPDLAGATTVTNVVNFGQKPFKYTPPTGFLPLCTANLPRPSIVRPDQYVGIVTYSGNNSTNVIRGLQFKPDFIWIKERSTNSGGTGAHRTYNSLTSYGEWLATNSTGAATVTGTLGLVVNGGFQVGTDNDINDSGGTYVAWCWKAGGEIGIGRSVMINDVGYATTTAAGLTAGTIPLTGASINTKSGFSIITWTGTGASSATIAHGLNALPNFVIIKKRNVIENWYIAHSGSGQGINYAYHLFFTTAGLSGSNDPYYMGSQVSLTSNILALADGTSNNGGNQSGTNYVAYCWTEIPGFSKFGSYTGNSNSDGVFVWCGFKPRYLLIKGTGSGGSGWIILDAVRDAYNASTKDLRADLTNSEPVSSGAVDFLSNGFKLRNTDTNYNSSSTSYGPYIFAAFAETPTQNLFGGQANAR